MDINNAELDREIAKSLKAVSADVTQSRDAIVRDIAATFQDQYRGILIIAWAKMIFVMLLAAFATWQFFQQDTTMAQIGYASLGIISVVSMCTIIIIFWSFVHRSSMLREIKRVELQVALLANRLERKD